MLNSKRMVGVPVKTTSGVPVGSVASLDFDEETGRLAILYVRARGVVSKLLEDELVVSWSQIVTITESEVVIKDAYVPQGVTVASAVPSVS